MRKTDQSPAAPPAGATAGVEIELKLSGRPEQLKRAFSSAAIRARAAGRDQTKRLENVYYDTEDQRLRARGLAFRVRKDGRRYYQTLKSNDAGGLAAYRGEWQTSLRSREPDLALMPSGAAAVLNGVVRSDELRAVFTTHVRRLIRRLEATDRHGRPSLVEAALDLGRSKATAAACRSPSSSSSCSRARPKRCTRWRWSSTRSPLHVETRSKSARGYALATGAPPAWHGRGLGSGPMRRSTTPSRPFCATASINGAPTRRRLTTAAIRRACTRCAWRSGACARHSPYSSRCSTRRSGAG